MPAVSCHKTDPSGDIADCRADITNSWIQSDLSNIYFRIKFACDLPQPLWGGNYYQIFIDADQNSSTGYKGYGIDACQWEIGADFMWENGRLYKHAGGSCDWLWCEIEVTPYALISSDNSQMEISIPRSSILTSPCELSKEKPLRFVLLVNAGGTCDVAPDSPKDYYYQWPSCPTVIELDQFSATPQSNQITLRWATLSEMNNAGFNIWRSESEDGKYIKINPNIIEAIGGATLNAEYAYDDHTAKPGITCYYKLEDMDTKGISTFHGPISAMSAVIAKNFKMGKRIKCRKIRKIGKSR